MPQKMTTKAPVGASVTTTLNMPPSVSLADPPIADDKPDFWTYIQQLSPEDWKTHIIYLTRENPKTRINGLGGYLTKLQQPFDIDDIKVAYGGYEFSYILKERNDICKNCRNATGRFPIEAPPKYDSTREEISGTNSNNGGSGADTTALLQQFVTVLRDELAHSREANSAPNPATDEAIKLLSSASEKAMDIVSKQLPNAGSSTHQLSELVTIVKQMMPVQNSGENSIITSLLKPLLEKVVNPPDPLAQITTFLTIFEKINAIRGENNGGDGRPKDWRSMLVEGLVQKGPEILEKIRENTDANVRAAEARRQAAEATRATAETIRNMPAPGSAPANGAPAAPASTVMPVGPFRTVPIDRNAPTVTPATSEQTMTTPPAGPGMNAMETDAVAKFMEQRIVDMIKEERATEDVVEFIEEIDHTLNDMLAQFTPDMVTTFLAGRPIIGAATRLPNWNAFLTAAQRYIKEIREEDKAIAMAASATPS